MFVVIIQKWIELMNCLKWRRFYSYFFPFPKPRWCYCFTNSELLHDAFVLLLFIPLEELGGMPSLNHVLYCGSKAFCCQNATFSWIMTLWSTLKSWMTSKAWPQVVLLHLNEQYSDRTYFIHYLHAMLTWYRI